MRARLCDHNGKSQQNTHPNIYLVVLLLLHRNGGQCVKTVNIYSNSIYQDDSLVSNVTNNSIFGRVNSKHTRKKNRNEQRNTYLRLFPAQAHIWFGKPVLPTQVDETNAIYFRSLHVPISVRPLRTMQAPSMPTKRMPPYSKSTMP